jgi:hypothetical protein
VGDRNGHTSHERLWRATEVRGDGCESSQKSKHSETITKCRRRTWHGTGLGRDERVHAPVLAPPGAVS